jgi:hypothetical protein
MSAFVGAIGRQKEYVHLETFIGYLRLKLSNLGRENRKRIKQKMIMKEKRKENRVEIEKGKQYLREQKKDKMREKRRVRS